MVKKQQLYARAKSSPGSIKFKELTKLAEYFGFELDHVSGSHHQYKRSDDPYGFMNFQPRPREKKMAKIFQVRQLVKFIDEHDLI